MLKVHIASCRPFSASIPQVTTAENHAELIRQITSLGSLSKYKETAELIRGIPLDPLIQSAVQNFKDGGKDQKDLNSVDQLSFDSSRYTGTNAFTAILDSMIFERSDKVLEVISYAKSDVVAANLIGATRLLRVCNILYNVSLDQSRKNELQASASSSSWKQATHQFSFDDRAEDCPNSKSGMKRNSTQAEIAFAQLFSPWLIKMTPVERWYQIRTIVKDMTYKITNTSSIRLIKTQIFHLHEELENINMKRGYVTNVDMTVIGDVAMASFDAFRLDGKVEKSVNILTELVAESK